MIGNALAPGGARALPCRLLEERNGMRIDSPHQGPSNEDLLLLFFYELVNVTKCPSSLVQFGPTNSKNGAIHDYFLEGSLSGPADQGVQ